MLHAGRSRDLLPTGLLDCFQFAQSFRLYCGPGVDSVPKRIGIGIGIFLQCKGGQSAGE
jgi:hypothetical protein